MIQLYCGDGKGKSTAAAGQALRAAANGMDVVFVQCLPNRTAGELKLLDTFENIHVMCISDSFSDTAQLLEEVKKKIVEADFDLIILDDAANAVEKDMLDSDYLKEFINKYCKNIETVITGSVPEMWMLDAADYVTDMEKIKHPYDKGVKKRKGIEY